MLIRVDVGDATVVALKMQATRRDHTVQGLEWRAGGPAPCRTRPRLEIGARHFALVLGWTTVGTERRPRRLHPGRGVGRFSRTGLGQRAGSEAAGPEQRDALREKEPPVEQSITGFRRSGKRVLRGASLFRHVVPAKEREKQFACDSLCGVLV